MSVNICIPISCAALYGLKSLMAPRNWLKSSLLSVHLLSLRAPRVVRVLPSAVWYAGRSRLSRLWHSNMFSFSQVWHVFGMCFWFVRATPQGQLPHNKVDVSSSTQNIHMME